MKSFRYPDGQFPNESFNYPSPLKFLFEKGANLEEVDKEGTTPLMVACSSGRLGNVKFIVETLSAGSSVPYGKMGIGGSERPQKNSWRPIHLAVADRKLDIVRYLLDLGVSADVPLNVRCDRMTPTMIAAANGDLVRSILWSDIFPLIWFLDNERFF